MYPIVAESTMMMTIEELERTNLSQSCLPQITVRAASLLRRDSATEVVDVNRLCQKSTSVVQYVEVAESDGRLYCVDGLVNAASWLKMVNFAKDCQSCNLLLVTTDKGVVLKAVRNIAPGEPLLMWFTENILAMLNMPFLTPSNIQGQNRYTCHICHSIFENPNPLKIHLALNCSRLDNNHLWTVLAKEFSSSPRPTLPLNLFPQTTFRFELSNSLTSSTTVISPILVETMNSSPASSNQQSPSSSNQPSPNSSTQISPNSSTQVSPIRNNLAHCQSAFKPYMNQSAVFPGLCPPITKHGQSVLTAYNNLQQPTTHAAQMETIVSNLGKSKQGHLCIYCGKVYSRKYGLKIHIRTHTGYKPLKCKFCQRPFGDPSNLNKHVRLHADGETPYRCELCGKVLVRRRDLERHIKSRHQNNVDPSSDTSSDGLDV
ncbi:hypothetical protein KPH14_010097 [Odynerus spinipes]|uniref:C2H2-type domain-containing protein n=1 Tax=Odynerus spinipes TaxID=1348599 RepID=A0AAD9RTP7_9HYME|nr:hypothetical protein KPH14_010097 [Odynerus spinipes]